MVAWSDKLQATFVIRRKPDLSPNGFIANDEFFEIKEHDGLPNLLEALKVGLPSRKLYNEELFREKEYHKSF